MNIEQTAIDAVQNKVKSYNDLTVNQKQKYAHLGGIYSSKELCLELTLLIEPKGENSWKPVTDKIDSIQQGDYITQMYHDTVYDNFVIGTQYSSDEIIQNIGQVRRDMKLATYISSIRKNCERDFFQLFIVHPVSAEICCEGNDEGGTRMKKITAGYKPMFRLKPEE